jgi:hypothetical protein
MVCRRQEGFDSKAATGIVQSSDGNDCECRVIPHAWTDDERDFSPAVGLEVAIASSVSIINSLSILEKASWHERIQNAGLKPIVSLQYSLICRNYVN